MYSINTDLKSQKGNPFPVLDSIFKNGFTHIQWIHHFNTDFVYMKSEIDEIKKYLDMHSLNLFEIHASEGVEKAWYSKTEYERKAGFELVKNRMLMTKDLGGDVIILHPFRTKDPKMFESGLKTLKDLYNIYQETGIKIALENMTYLETFNTLTNYFSFFDPDFLVFCWDTGHSNNVGEEAFLKAEKFAKDRLYALHLNDNSANGKDEHLIPFDGTINWDRVLNAVAASYSYPKNHPFTFEVSTENYNCDIDTFLSRTYEVAVKVRKIVQEKMGF